MDIHHQEWYFCFFIAVFIFIFGFGISFLFNFLNKKLEKCIFPVNSEEEIEERDERDEQKLFIESGKIEQN